MRVDNARTTRTALRLLVTIAALLLALASGKAEASEIVAEIGGETMGMNPLGAGGVVPDSGAVGGRYLQMWANGTASTTVTTSQPTSEVVLRLRGQVCRGAPQATIRIDGWQVATRTVGSATWASYSVPVSNLAAGTHTVQIGFANDYYLSSSCDRNLHVDHVTLNAADTPAPVPEPDPAPVPEPDPAPAPEPALLFADTFDRDADSFVPPWNEVNSAAVDRITTDASIVRRGTHSAKFHAQDGDVYPLTYTENPRAQIAKTNLFCNNTESWIGYSTYFPSDFPRYGGSGWHIFNNAGFGPPYGSVDSAFVGLVDWWWGDTIAYNYAGQNFYRTPLERGRWIDWVVHVNWSSDPSVGYVEIWKDGAKQTMLNGTQRKYHTTYDPRMSGSCVAPLVFTNYRQKGMYETATIYQDEVKVGTSYAAVAP